ncbi:hypothetical protein EDD15DRAFT_2523129 [Pisolithus albus]|nr:hypothetical protein EDD15DRAFT_2523129 [Pisolithus albus]
MMPTYYGDIKGTWQLCLLRYLKFLDIRWHVFEDDIESFVHVLGWTVLSCLPSPMDRYERADLVSYLYDHSFRDTTGRERGGRAKEVQFQAGDYPSKYFTLTEPSPILELIRDLASPFRARYEDPPTEAELETFEYIITLVSNGQLREEALYCQTAHRYQLGIRRLSSSEWFLGTIQDALKRPCWPAKDGGGAKLTICTEDTARQGVGTDFLLISASSGPLKRSTTPPPPAPQDKRSRLDDSSEGGVTRE